jgi:hypothetical protein
MKALPSQHDRDAIVTTWTKFWDLSRPYLVEKSPKSMLKTCLYLQLFNLTTSKFLITIKHPLSSIRMYSKHEFKHFGTDKLIHRMLSTNITTEHNNLGYGVCC